MQQHWLADSDVWLGWIWINCEEEGPLTLDMPPLPNYTDAGISNVMPAVFLHLARSRGSLLGRSLPEIEEKVFTINAGLTPDLESWFPKEANEASQIVLLVLDGLGFNQLVKFSAEMPSLAEFSVSRISSVAPTTTATALTSISTGATPATHGLLGYRMPVDNNKVMNMLSWSYLGEPGRVAPRPEDVQPAMPFLNFQPNVVTKAKYKNSGFTMAHLRGTHMFDYRFPSTMVDHVCDLLSQDEAFVYAYYEGVDTVAHEYGLSTCYREELRAVDYFLGRLLSSLPSGAMLLVTSDHGQVEVPEAPIELDERILGSTSFLSGEGRFRWLHVKGGAQKRVLETARELYSGGAWVVSKEELIDGGYFGSSARNVFEDSRLGDVALIARSNVAFYDPNDTGPYNLVCRHGSLTADELEVPLLSYLV
ncbi:MAG: PglZ domain-containing protein [Actinomycetota bacterium]|nr:MAG: PglZ domain-containing protein [Actinomycetota bacterium]